MNHFYSRVCLINWVWPLLSLVVSIFFLIFKRRWIFTCSSLFLLIQGLFLAFFPNFSLIAKHDSILCYYVVMRFIIPSMILACFLFVVFILYKEDFKMMIKQKIDIIFVFSFSFILVFLFHFVFTFVDSILHPIEIITAFEYSIFVMAVVPMIFCILPLLYRRAWILLSIVSVTNCYYLFIAITSLPYPVIPGSYHFFKIYIIPFLLLTLEIAFVVALLFDRKKRLSKIIQFK